MFVLLEFKKNSLYETVLICIISFYTSKPHTLRRNDTCNWNFSWKFPESISTSILEIFVVFFQLLILSPTYKYFQLTRKLGKSCLTWFPISSFERIGGTLLFSDANEQYSYWLQSQPTNLIALIYTSFL